MATQIPIKVTCGRMPVNYEDTWQHTFQAMVRRLRGTVDSSQILTGIDSSTGSLYDVGGPWFVNLGGPTSSWRAWNVETGEYDPEKKQITGSDSRFNITLEVAPLTGSHDMVFQDKTGTIANLIDIYAPRSTTILTGATPSIDWSTTFDFFELLSANTTFTFANKLDGETITVCLQNLGTAFTATWPTLKWPGGTPPTMPISTGTPGGSAIGIYTFRDIHGTIYGELVNASPASPAAFVTPGGNPPISNYGGSGNVGSIGANRVYLY